MNSFGVIYLLFATFRSESGVCIIAGSIKPLVNGDGLYLPLGAVWTFRLYGLASGLVLITLVGINYYLEVWIIFQCSKST